MHSEKIIQTAPNGLSQMICVLERETERQSTTRLWDFREKNQPRRNRLLDRICHFVSSMSVLYCVSQWSTTTRDVPADRLV